MRSCLAVAVDWLLRRGTAGGRQVAGGEMTGLVTDADAVAGAGRDGDGDEQQDRRRPDRCDQLDRRVHAAGTGSWVYTPST